MFHFDIFESSNCKVYVGNLAWAASEQGLKEHMIGAGQDLNVVNVEILADSSGRSKGCAIVEYATREVM
jgi:RNA recognition motif-containing protein